MSAQHPLLRLAFVSKRFLLAGSRSDFVAVDRVCLDIAAGQRFGIVGGSSAGRSRLLRLINLLKRPDAGGVVIDGRGLTRLSRRDLREARAGIGMIQRFDPLQNVARADCGGDDRPIGGTSFVAADAAPVERAARRRVGGLPLPGTTAPLDAGRAARSVVHAQVAVGRWVCRFPAPRVATVDASDRGETVAPVRRVGGLPMPGKRAPVDRVGTSAPSSLSPGVPDPRHLDLTSPGRPIRIGVTAGPHAQIAEIA